MIKAITAFRMARNSPRSVSLCSRASELIFKVDLVLETSQTPTFALGDASGVNTELTLLIMMLDTTDDNQRVLHFLQPGFSATEDKTAIASNAQPIQAYKSPGSLGESGLRKYSFLMYSQPSNFKASNMPSQGSTINVKDFLSQNNLQPALAGIGMQVQMSGGSGTGSQSSQAPAPAVSPSSAPSVAPVASASAALSAAASAAAPAVSSVLSQASQAASSAPAAASGAVSQASAAVTSAVASASAAIGSLTSSAAVMASSAAPNATLTNSATSTAKSTSASASTTAKSSSQASTQRGTVFTLFPMFICIWAALL